jgi:hypothetical protein
MPVPEFSNKANPESSGATGIVSSDSPLALIVDMLAHENGEESRSSSLYRCTFWLGTASLGIGLGALALSGVWHSEFPLWVAAVALVVGAIVAPINVFVGVRETWIDLKGLQIDLLRSVSKRLAKRRNLVLEIGMAFSYEEITFARDFLSSIAAQTRSRIGLIVGAIDKIGVLAIIGSVTVALIKLPDQGRLSYTLYAGTVVGVFFYMVFAHMWATVSSYEHHVVLLEHAAQHAQERANSKG